MRRLAGLLVLATAPAWARDLTDTNADPQISARLVGTHVELTARYSLDVEGPSFVPGGTLSIPDGAVVTGAVASIDGKKHRLALVDADRARGQFDNLGTTDDTTARAWAIHLSSTRTSGVTIDIAAARTAHATLELSLEMASCFYRDRRYVLLPKTWFVDLAGRPAPTRDAALDAACASGKTEDDEWLGFAAPVPRWPADARIGALAGRLPLTSADLAKVELDLSSELTKVPSDLATAIVVDRSRSLKGDEVETERAVIESYLQRVPPQSRVQLIAFARTPTALLPAWMPASAAAPRIVREIRALAPRNGSNVDEAIAEAGRWLSHVTGTRRLIVISDNRFATRIETMKGADFKTRLPDNTLVHIVNVSSGLIGIVRANADLQTEVDDLDDLPVLTGGIAVDAGLDDKRPLDATILVRPVSLDSLTISGGDWKPLGINNCPVADEVLAAGRTCTTWLTGHSTSGAITVEAFLWGRKISRTVLPDPTAARHIARELSLESGVFDDEMQTQIEHAAFALNNVWSLIAVWGGSGGYSDVGGWGLGLSGIGTGGCCDRGGSRDVGVFGHIGGKLDLRPQLAPVVEKCGAHTALKIWLETTRDEIVAVDVDAPKETEPVRHCLEDAVWELALAIPDPDAMSHLNTMTEFAAR